MLILQSASTARRIGVDQYLRKLIRSQHRCGDRIHEIQLACEKKEADRHTHTASNIRRGSAVFFVCCDFFAEIDDCLRGKW